MNLLTLLRIERQETPRATRILGYFSPADSLLGRLSGDTSIGEIIR